MTLRSPDLFKNRDGTLALGQTEFFTGSPDELSERVGTLANSPRPTLVLTVNVDHTVKYLDRPEAREVFSRADLVTLDGAPLVALSRMLGIRGAQRNTGADLLISQSETSAIDHRSIAIVGGADEVGALAEQELRSRFPGSVITHVPLPFMSDVSDPGSLPTIETLKTLAPSVVFLCMGFPKQELWFIQWQDQLPGGVYVGAGAAVDFAAGTRKRAPRVAQRLGGEWLWRIAQEPGRLARRYLVESLPFFSLAARSVLRKGQP